MGCAHRDAAVGSGSRFGDSSADKFGGSSGAVPPFDLIALSQKGSLYVTRPTLGHYLLTPEELAKRAAAVFGMIKEGSLKLRIEHRYPLSEAEQAHRDLEGRKTTGKLLLTV